MFCKNTLVREKTGTKYCSPHLGFFDRFVILVRGVETVKVAESESYKSLLSNDKYSEVDLAAVLLCEAVPGGKLRQLLKRCSETRFDRISPETKCTFDNNLDVLLIYSRPQ